MATDDEFPARPAVAQMLEERWPEFEEEFMRWAKANAHTPSVIKSVLAFGAAYRQMTIGLGPEPAIAIAEGICAQLRMGVAMLKAAREVVERETGNGV